ncbi:hypothetical protein V3481_007352 [Fusarium oxysporum f. sp. vasinfectum]|uniref:BZIP domain-containing protein n=1 Tax=Fusarium oxysporum f. sp. vasinfectum 25433 TaxID=1089449 RepID=X0KKF4_FUSOX|nr:hypothetical protein FOTG_17474 [Fusarium oxysporum f. sp. vasinfectum 25433]
MTPSSSTEPAEPKRNGVRRISTLTPSQLARKRVKDREAQRAIRARTKEHIERLDRELAELRMRQSRDQTVQELLHRNRALEEELVRLKKNVIVQITSSLSSSPGLNSPQLSLSDSLVSTSTVNNNLGTSSDAIPSPRGSPFPGNYNYFPDYNQQYVPLSNNCESCASTVSCPIPFNFWSPLSSADYSAGHISINVPSWFMLSNTNSSSVSVMFHKDVVEMEYNNVGRHSIISQGLPLPDVVGKSGNPPCLQDSDC